MRGGTTRITGAFMSYWIYQHIGNLSPPELAEEQLLRLVQRDDDAGPRLRELARRWDRESAASRWAFYRDRRPDAYGDLTRA